MRGHMSVCTYRRILRIFYCSLFRAEFFTVTVHCHIRFLLLLCGVQPILHPLLDQIPAETSGL